MDNQRALTPRQAIKELLAGQALSLRELSQELRLSEREVLAHLEHIARAPGPGLRFHLTPPVCQQCGFVFRKRARLRTPSRCPLCRGEAISRPRYALVPAP